MPRERRNVSHIGQKRRSNFDRSTKQLYDLGLAPWAVEYFRRAARVSGVLPHMVVCQVAMMAAGRMLSRSAEAALERESANDPASASRDGAAHAEPHAEPSYLAICAKRNHVQSLWREIQRQESDSSLQDARGHDSDVADGNGDRSEEWNKGNSRLRRRGGPPSKHH